MDQWKCIVEITKRKCTIKCTCNLAYNWEFDEQIMVDHHHVICDKILIMNLKDGDQLLYQHTTQLVMKPKRIAFY